MLFKHQWDTIIVFINILNVFIFIFSDFILIVK